MANQKNNKTRIIIEFDDNLDKAGQYAYMESNKWYDIANILTDNYASQKYICLLFSCELYLKAILMFNNINVTKKIIHMIYLKCLKTLINQIRK